MPTLEGLQGAADAPARRESLLRDMLQHRQLVGTPSNASDAAPEAGSADASPIVLVVDDDATLLATFAEMLARSFRVVTATNGVDAVATFRTTPVDAIVTDLAMPGMNGLQVASLCKTIRPGVPVVMVTAWEALIASDEASRHGIDTILTKPVRATTLLRAVRDLTR